MLRLTLVFDLFEAGVVEAYPLAGKAATLTIDSDHPRVETGISKIYTRKGACCPAGTVNGCKFVRSADYAGHGWSYQIFFEDEVPYGAQGPALPCGTQTTTGDDFYSYLSSIGCLFQHPSDLVRINLRLVCLTKDRIPRSSGRAEGDQIVGTTIAICQRRPSEMILRLVYLNISGACPHIRNEEDQCT